MSARNKIKIDRPFSNQSIPYVLILLAFGIGFGTHIFITSIFAETSSTGVIHACIQKRSGEVRIISNFEEYKNGKKEKDRRENREDKNGCRENESALEWNVQGPPGNSDTGSSQTVGAFVTNDFSNMEFSIERSGTWVYRNFDNANFSNSKLMDSVGLDHSSFRHVNFSHATLEVTATNTDFSEANFSDANLTGTDMSNAVITNATWSNTICPDGSNSDSHSNSCEGHLTPNQPE